MASERSVGRPWTGEEDGLLARAVGEHGEQDNWKRVAESVPGRTNKACRKVSDRRRWGGKDRGLTGDSGGCIRCRRA